MHVLILCSYCLANLLNIFLLLNLDTYTCHVDLTVLKLLISRTSQSEFIVSVNKYLEARNHKLSVGMRFKMRFEGEEVPERR